MRPHTFRWGFFMFYLEKKIPQMDALEQFKTWLTNVPFITEEDCAFFLPWLKVKQFKAREYFVAEGTVCKEVGFVTKGAFRTFYLQEGKEINTCFYFENQFVVEYDSFLKNSASRYFIQALEDAETVCFSQPIVQDAYQRSKNWEHFGRLMAEESYKMVARRMEDLLFLDGEQRYLKLLQEEPQLFERVPLYHIASYLGVERESLSRLRKKVAGKERL